MATRVIYFELNGQPREVIIEDMNVESDVIRKIKLILQMKLILRQQCQELS